MTGKVRIASTRRTVDDTTHILMGSGRRSQRLAVAAPIQRTLCCPDHSQPRVPFPHHLTLLLRAVSMDGGGGQLVAGEDALKLVGAALGLHEDQCQALL